VGVQNISMNGMEVCLNPLSTAATGANLHGFVLSKTGARHGMAWLVQRCIPGTIAYIYGLKIFGIKGIQSST